MGPFSNLPLSAKLWVYTADRNLSETETNQIQQQLNQFTAHWTSHEVPLEAASEIAYHRIILIAVNEAVQTIGGCGIDKSVQLIQAIGKAHQLNFFDRLQILVKEGEQIVSYNKAGIQEAIRQGKVSEDTMVFNPLVTKLGDLKEKGFVRLREFWMAPQLIFESPVQA